MTKYIIYFEPVEIDADNQQDAEDEYKNGHADPFILKIIPAEFVFDCEPKKEKIV